MRVVLGGTFDRLHPGHEALLSKAFEVGDEVFIGLTSQGMAQATRQRRVQSFATRRRNLERLLRRHGWRATIAEITHPYGRATDPRYNAIVVSQETAGRVDGINRNRARKGLRPLKVFTIPFLYAADGLRISATRIASGDIDARGRRLRPLRVAVGTDNEVKVRAVREAFAGAFPSCTIRVQRVRVRSGVPEQPTEQETYRGAQLRAERALASSKAEYAVGIEAGLLHSRFLRLHLDVQYVVVLDRAGGRSTSHGGGFYYPPYIEKKVLAGRTVSDVMGPLAGDARLGSTTGAVGFLSKGAVDRRELTRHAVLLALIPRIRPELYEEPEKPKGRGERKRHP